MNRLTYLNNNLKNGCIIRWPEQCFPLPVYIAPCSWYSMSEADRYTYKNMVIEALNTWEKIAEGRFSFTIVDSLNDSQMNVEWRRVDSLWVIALSITIKNQDYIPPRFQ